MAIRRYLAGRRGVLVMAAATTAFAGAMGALVPIGCSGSDSAAFVPGPLGVPSVAIVQVGLVPFAPDAGATGDTCVPIGTDPDAEIPVVVTVAQIDLRPPGIVTPPTVVDTPSGPVLTNAGGTDGPCTYPQCGHLVLSARDADDPTATDLYNNSGSSSVIALLMRKFAQRSAHLVLTVEVLNDSNAPIQHNGVATTVKSSVTITTSPTCGGGGAGGSGGATASTAVSGAGGAGGSGGVAGMGGATSSGMGGAGGATGSGGSGGSASSGATSSATGTGGAGGAASSVSASSVGSATGVGGALPTGAGGTGGV